MPHLAREIFFLPYTKVLGYVACRVSSKCLGIGSADRSWEDTKHIKSGKRSHMSAASIEKKNYFVWHGTGHRGQVDTGNS